MKFTDKLTKAIKDPFVILDDDDIIFKGDVFETSSGKTTKVTKYSIGKSVSHLKGLYKMATDATIIRVLRPDSSKLE